MVFCTRQPFVKIDIYLKEDFLQMTILNLTEIFTNCVGLLRQMFCNQPLETTNHWLKGYH